MIWLNPSALFALAAVAAPILIHLLIQHRAERFPFPTLRFLRPTRLAAIRRHMIDEVVLLAVRAALLAAAVAALAGPLFVTAARRQTWDQRIVRAVVIDASGADSIVARPFQNRDPGADSPAPYLQREFTAASLADGVRRAILWLDAAPPARREILVASPFPIGSLTAADVAAIPGDIGVRLERAGTLPKTRAVPAGRLLTSGGARARDVTLAGDQTSVRDAADRDPMVWPIDVVSSSTEKPAIDAAIAAVLSQHVWAAPPDRRARLVIVDAVSSTTGAQGFSPAIPDVSPIQQPWMADAVARIAGDPDLRAAAVRVTGGLGDPRFAAAPWQTLTSAADGRPLAVAAGTPNRLMVVSAAPASDVATPVLLRSIANAIAPLPDLQRAEVVPTADAVLRHWSRPSGPPAPPRIETVDRDDRRWLWLAALCLLGLEMWMRRALRSSDAGQHREEVARVA